LNFTSGVGLVSAEIRHFWNISESVLVATEQCFDEDGWFCSGDVGIIYPNGSLKIIDRSKNIFKLSQGEYIAPEKVENTVIISKYVDQIFVYGDSLQDCCVTVIVANEPAAKAFAEENGKSFDYAAACKDKDFIKAVLDDVTTIARSNKLTSLEIPKEAFLTHEPFSPENCLTPTFKLKRAAAKAMFLEEIGKMYAAFKERMSKQQKK
jgi:long-chain acyl-CoA synthetase